MKKRSSRRIVALGVLTALALVLSFLESLLPPLTPVPGIKLGLPNLVIVFLLYRMGWKEAGAVSVIRVLLVSLLFGSAVSLAYAAAGAVLSLVVMALLKRSGLFSPAGVSVAGGVIHNLAQTGVACLLLRSPALLTYLPVLVIGGCVAGVLIGLLSVLLVAKVPAGLTE